MLSENYCRMISGVPEGRSLDPGVVVTAVHSGPDREVEGFSRDLL